MSLERLRADSFDGGLTSPRRTRQNPTTGEWWVRCDAGHEHYGEHGAAGLLLVHGSQMHVLLQERAAWVDHGGTWGIPSGALHPGEDPRVGAMREAREEGVGTFNFAGAPQTFVADHGGWVFHTVVVPVKSKPVTHTNSEARSWTWARWVDLVTGTSMLRLHPGLATFIDEHARDI